MQMTITIEKHPRKPGKQIAMVETETGAKYVLLADLGKLSYGKVIVAWVKQRKLFRHLNRAAVKKYAKIFKVA